MLLTQARRWWRVSPGSSTPVTTPCGSRHANPTGSRLINPPPRKGAPVIRHIVLFQAADGTPVSQLQEAADALEALVGKIPGLISMTAGVEGVGLPGNYDLGLVAELEDEAALTVYADHPAHLEVVALVGAFKVGRAGIDIRV
nr:Dabb family protein [Microbacterium amylolyticum]